MRVVWKIKILQNFSKGTKNFNEERFIGKEDLYQTLVERMPYWKRQVFKLEDKTELICIRVTILSAEKICELTK